MASISQCQICSKLDKSVPADKWCTDCEHFLCNECVTVHKESRVSQPHRIIDAETLTLPKQCASHPKLTLDFFCTQHDILCCEMCISDNHRSCDKVDTIQVACKNATISTLYRDTADGMKQILETRNRIIQNRTEIKDRVVQEENDIVRKIAKVKESLIQQLDDMENIIRSELQIARKNAVKLLENEKVNSKKSVSKLEKYLTQLDVFTKKGSDLHVFLLLHELQPIVSEENCCLENIVPNLSEPRLIFLEPNQNFVEGKWLGSVTIKEEKSGLQYCPSKHMQAQIISAPKSFKLCDRIGLKNGDVTGLTTDSNDNLVITSRDRLLSYSKNGKYINECKLGSDAWDVSFHSTSGNVVVALQENGIQLVNNFTPGRVVKCKNAVFGVSSGNENIFVGDTKGNLHIFSSELRHLKALKFGRDDFYYVHYRRNKIYISEPISDVVHCINDDGSPIFNFTSSTLEMPNCIATDRPGNVYVVGRDSNNIHRLSKNAKKSEVVLGPEDGLKDPSAICFSKDYSKLFLSNEDGASVYVYECQY
ncbi:uncharacterized protein LOC127710814 [Mytilus californianus]|uniref:uncharacterized protein LOC127710814 n=1 Tax=Mytilus californianus TaxID=6549 RepID=UPI002246D7B7|nr:uncharacterized protein LOC127710814 [Mytilus californianus]